MRGCRQPELRREPEIGGDRLGDVELALHRVNVTELHERQGAVVVALERAFVQVVGLGHGDELAGQLVARRRVVRPEERGATAVEGVRDRLGIVQTAGHLESLAAEVIPRRSVSFVAQRAGQACQQADAKRAVVHRDGCKRTPKENNDPSIPAGSRPDEASAVAEGRAGQAIGQPMPRRQLGGFGEGIFGDRAATRPRRGITECKEHVAVVRDVRCAGATGDLHG